MNLKRIATAWLVLMLIALPLLTSVSGPAAGNEAEPNSNEDRPETGIIDREQIVYVTIENTSEMRIDYFLDPVSIVQGEQVSLSLPISGEPSSVTVTNSTKGQFMAAHNIGHAKRVAQRQSGLGHALTTTLSDYPATFFGGFFLPPIIMLTVDLEEPPHYGGYGDNDAVLSGDSINLDEISYTSNSGGSQSNSQTEHQVLVNFTTRTPLQNSNYFDLIETFPQVMKNLSLFVRNQTSIHVNRRYNIDTFCDRVYDKNLSRIYRDLIQTSRELNRTYNISNVVLNEYRIQFNWLVAFLYGYGEITGHAISITVPITDGNIIIPGASHFNENSSVPLNVIFDHPDSLSLDLNREPTQNAFDEGRHYSLFSWEEAGNGSTLKGAVKNDDMFWKERQHRSVGFIYTHGFVILLSLIISGIFILSYWLFATTFDQELPRKEWRLIVLLASTVVIGTILGGFLISLLLCMGAFAGGPFSRNNVKALLGPAGDNIPKLTVKERAYRPLWGIVVVVASIFFFIFLAVLILSLINVRTAPGVVFWAAIFFSFVTGILGFSLEKSMQHSLQSLSHIQRLILNRMAPAISNEGQTYAAFCLLALFGVFPLSLFGSILIILSVFGDLTVWTGFVLPMGISILITGYLLIKLRDLEDIRKERDRRLFDEAIIERPEINDHIMWVKWYGSLKYVQLMRVPTNWDGRDNSFYYPNLVTFKCPYDCQPIHELLSCRITWTKFYSTLKVPEKFSIANHVWDGPNGGLRMVGIQANHH